MKQCPCCRRHIFCQDHECPFCEVPLPDTGPFLAGVPIALGLTLASCAPAPAQPADIETMATGSSTGDVDGDSTAATPMESSTGASEDTSFGTTVTDDGTTVATDDDSADGPAGFYGVAPDFGPDIFECDLDEQDCPQGEKCVPWANDGGPVWNATACRPVDADPVGLGEACDAMAGPTGGVDTCDAGLACFLVDGRGQGVCSQLCSEAEPACTDGSDCAVIPEAPEIGFCVVPGLCDPLGTDCGDAEVCVPTVPQTYQCLPEVSAAQLGDPCAAQNSCGPGLLCVDGAELANCETDACCTSFCNPAGLGLVCPAKPKGYECVDLGAGVGACLVQ